MSYGREIILDIDGCDIDTFTRPRIRDFLVELCDVLRLERADLHFWDYGDLEAKADAPAHLKGVSAVQFIMTSTIVVHTLDETKQVLINVFGCGEIDAAVVERITIKYFGGRIAKMYSLERGC